MNHAENKVCVCAFAKGLDFFFAEMGKIFFKHMKTYNEKVYKNFLLAKKYILYQNTKYTFKKISFLVLKLQYFIF